MFRRLTWSFYLSLAAAGLIASTGPSVAATYGLVIGIDDYIGRSNDLAGAVNDAEDIAAALAFSGAVEVVLLINGAAHRAAIEAAWANLINAASPGDTIVFSFAGHGAQEPEPPGRNGEEDGLNETFVLAGYQSFGSGAIERIVDDEIFAWLRQAEDRGLEVIFVADSCHSGTMYRSLNIGTLRNRAGDFDPPEDPGATLLPGPSFATIREIDFERVTFIGATEEDRLTPELMIDGTPRGALSWAFARALEGAADRDGDHVLTQLELLNYLVPAVEIHAHNQQTPTILPLAPVPRALIWIGHPGEENLAAVPDRSDRLIGVMIRGDADLPDIVGVWASEGDAEADLVWDVAQGTVDHRVAGRVAEGVGPSGISAVLAKWAALALIESIAAHDPFTMDLLDGNMIHSRGEILTVALSGGQRRHLTLINLPPDGRVELLVPANLEEVERDWRRRETSLQLQVADPPYGAEHLLAILTDDPAIAFHAALAGMNTAESSAGLPALLMTLLSSTGVQAGILGIYTAAE